MAAKKAKGALTTGTWVKRIIALSVLGLAIGGGIGVAAVRALEPGRPVSRDSVELLLDSTGVGAPKTDARSQRRASDSAEATNRIQRVRDSIEYSRTLVTVPDVIGLEEGLARTRLTDAKLTVGTAELEDSRTPAGTVLRTVPGAGESQQINGTVTLVLSNGRTPPTDFAFFAPQP